MQSQVDKGIIEHIKNIADPETVAMSLGISFYGPKGRFLRSYCPVHGGKNKTSFSLDTQTGFWSCFSSGCHNGYSDLIGLVELVRRCNFVEAVKFLAVLFGVDTSQNYGDEVAGAFYKKDITEFVRRSQADTVELDLCTIPNIEEVIYKAVLNRSDYFIRRGYTPSILDYFEVGSARDRYGIPRESFPIRDEHGRIVAVDGRRTDSDENPRYLADPPGFKKGKVLYNYYRAKSFISIFGGNVFVVEGYKACWSMVQAGYLNTVACMGAGFQGTQAKLLLKDLNLRKIFMVLDSDAAGKNGAQRAQSQLGSFCPIEIIDMPVTSDPVSNEKIFHDPSTLSPEELHSIIIPYMSKEKESN